MASRNCQQCLPGFAPVRAIHPDFAPTRVTPEAIRRRRATANRVLTILKAALNEAYHEGRIPINEAWQRVKAFRKVDSARIRYLTDDEARRLVNACPVDFRALVVGGLMTGCRYGELAALVVEDFNVDSGTLTNSDQQERKTSSRRVVS